MAPHNLLAEDQEAINEEHYRSEKILDHFSEHLFAHDFAILLYITTPAAASD